MADSKVQRENFISLQGWQVVDLGLKGNELIIYACIYGFSQNEQAFSGGLQYLADWTNSTKRGVMKNLQSLTEKGFISKKEHIENGVKFCEYRAVYCSSLVNKVHRGSEPSSPGVVNKVHRGSEPSSPGVVNKVHRGSEQSSPNNIDNNISNNKVDKIDYQLIADLYNKTCVSFPKLKSISDARKKEIKARLHKYSIDDFRTLFEKAEASRFLKGSNNRNWSATFDWLIKDQNMVKVLEGNYDDRKKETRASRNRDYSYLENIRPEPLEEGEGLDYI